MHRGAGRLVYPGFVQLGAFMSMNLGRHVRAHAEMHGHLARGDVDGARALRAFYEEYFAVADLPAEFYLETVERIFQEHLLPQGRLRWRGGRVDPRAIRRTALFTVEGEKDDICAVGQTVAAQELCTGLRPSMRRHHVQIGAGHYGVFNGARWQNEIYPQLRSVIHTSG
jgi:polyhydroxyalkanoate depolymerase